MSTLVEIEVNGTKRRVETDPNRSLLGVLRDEWQLTGTKYGCGEGRCGACTVLINGKATRSCLTPVGDCEGKRITTIEGLEKDGKLHPVQAAFIAMDAMQCGYCTPGMIMSATALLDRNGNPTPSDIVRSMEGNICRCGTYARIVRAVQQAAAGLKGGAR